MALNGLHAVIDIESWWVGSHIKLSYDLKQNVTEVRTQFDMAVNPLRFNINLKTMVLACRNGWCVLVLECHFQKSLFFMNYFYKQALRLISGDNFLQRQSPYYFLIMICLCNPGRLPQ